MNVEGSRNEHRNRAEKKTSAEPSVKGAGNGRSVLEKELGEVQQDGWSS